MPLVRPKSQNRAARKLELGHCHDLVIQRVFTTKSTPEVPRDVPKQTLLFSSLAFSLPSRSLLSCRRLLIDNQRRSFSFTKLELSGSFTVRCGNCKACFHFPYLVSLFPVSHRNETNPIYHHPAFLLCRIYPIKLSVLQPFFPTRLHSKWSRISIPTFFDNTMLL